MPRDGSQPSTPSRFLRKHEVAARLGVSVDTVERRIKDGSLKAVRIGRAVRIAEQDFQAFVRRSSTWR
jgi:excisionase family DNA binding protein